MITRIEAYRYRCFQRLDVVLDEYQVLVGANGSGKTTLLDIPVLLGDMLMTRNVQDALLRPVLPYRKRSRATSAGEVIHFHRGSDFILAIEAKLPDEIVPQLVGKLASSREGKKVRESTTRWPERVRYEVLLEVFSGALSIAHEFLFILPKSDDYSSGMSGPLMGQWALPDKSAVIPVIRRPKGEPAEFYPEQKHRRNWKTPFSFRLQPTELALSSLPSDREKFGAAHWLRELLIEQTCPYQFDLVAMHEAKVPSGKNPKLAADGTMLPWLVIELAEDRAACEEWTESIRLALPSIQMIEGRVREDDGFAYLKLTYEHGLTVLSSGLSDGTLAILGLTILPYLKNPPRLVIVEEPEDSLHPRAIETVLESLSSVRNSQVLVSSHSPVVVAHTELDDLLCLRQSPGEGSSVTPGRRHPGLATWKGQPGLATLFSAGVLG